MKSTKRQIITSLLGLVLCVSPITAQVFDSGPSDPALFDIVMNLPPDPNIGDNQSIGGDGSFTQLNVSDGGSVGRSFEVFSGTELNVSDGGLVVRGFEAFSGTEVNISGGTVGDAFFSAGEVNISGGAVGIVFTALSGSVVNISGCLLYTSPSPRDRQKSRMPSSA